MLYWTPTSSCCDPYYALLCCLVCLPSSGFLVVLRDQFESASETESRLQPMIPRECLRLREQSGHVVADCRVARTGESSGIERVARQYAC